MRTKKVIKIIRNAVIFVVLLLAVAVHAQDIPDNDGWVTDLGGFLTPQQEVTLEQLMESYKQGSSNEIALLTVPTLGRRSLEGYALEVARKWRIGEQGKNNGALLLVSRSEHKVRIEVGRGLEGNITDAISGRIIRGLIAPEFKKGHFYEGLSAGIQAMHEAAGGDYGNIPKEIKGKSDGSIGLIPLLIMFFIISRLFRRRHGGGRGSGLLGWLLLGSMMSGGGGSSGSGFGGGSFSGFGGGGGFSGGGASGGW
ncbi:TPM domain-containing protein [bacterium]|nr:TPM domain-containing protein [bacterium]